MQRPASPLIRCILLSVLAAVPARASEIGDQKACAKRVGEAVMDHAAGYLGTRLACERDLLSTPDGPPCAENGEVARALADVSEKLASRIAKCSPVGFALLCPLGATDPAAAWTSVVAGDERASLDALAEGLFGAPTCGAPQVPVSKAGRDCARTISNEVPKAVAKIQQCTVKCEVSWTASGGEICVDLQTGVPLKDKAVECVDRVRERLFSAIANRCDAGDGTGPAPLVELGCPLGATGAAEFQLALRPLVDRAGEAIGAGLFHSACRTVIPVNPVSPTAEAELGPSGRTVTVACGDVLDGDFFGEDTRIELRSNLDCQNASTSNGLVIDAPGIAVTFEKEVRLIGRGNAGSPNGIGLRLTRRAAGVSIRKGVVKAFGIGIADDAGTADLRIEQMSVQSNLGHGLQLRGAGAFVSASSVKRNGGSGLSLEGDHNRIDSNTFDENGGAGIDVSGTDNMIENNQLGSLTARGNGASGLRVLADGNRVSSNRADANVVAGYEIRGSTPVYENNRATRNFGPGHDLAVSGVFLESNRADENGGWEFLVAPFCLDLGGNRANGETIGFGDDGGAFE